MNSGFEMKLPGGGDVRVRRCYEDIPDQNDVKEIVEFTIETFTPYWSLSSLCLNPGDAALIGSALQSEAVKELRSA